MNSEGGRKSFRGGGGGVRVRSIVSRQWVLSLLPLSFLPYAAPVGVAEGAPHPPGERPTPTIRNWSAKRLCKSGRLTACPRTRPRARPRSRSGGEPLLGASQHGAAFCRFVNRPVRPAAAGRPAHRHPDAERRGRPEILKSRNQFSIINHIFCQTAEGGREAGRTAEVKSFGVRPGQGAAGAMDLAGPAAPSVRSVEGQAG